MQPVRFALAAALSVVALAAHAESPDPSGQFAVSTGPATRAQVQAELSQYRQSGVNPWSTSYNPLKQFHSQQTRAEVKAEFLANREAVRALTSEDSGAAYLARQGNAPAARQFAGQPARSAQ